MHLTSYVGIQLPSTIEINMRLCLFALPVTEETRMEMLFVASRLFVAVVVVVVVVVVVWIWFYFCGKI